MWSSVVTERLKDFTRDINVAHEQIMRAHSEAIADEVEEGLGVLFGGDINAYMHATFGNRDRACPLSYDTEMSDTQYVDTLSLLSASTSTSTPSAARRLVLFGGNVNKAMHALNGNTTPVAPGGGRREGIRITADELAETYKEVDKEINDFREVMLRAFNAWWPGLPAA